MGGNDYVIQVKDNQKKLKAAIVDYIEKHEADDIFLKRETNRGRKENREARVYRRVKGEEFRKWDGLNEVVVVKQWGERKHKSSAKKKEYEEIHYYISSRKELKAKVYAKRIREHWWIENKQHWVKDVILYEDNSLVKGKELAENLSLIRIIVMNLYRINNQQSIKHAIEKFTNKLNICNLFIYNKYSSE